jgi:hypothetical protein
MVQRVGLRGWVMGDAHGGVSVGVLVEARYGGWLVDMFESLMGCRLLPWVNKCIYNLAVV